MFIAALITDAKRCKQPECPSRDARKNKNVVYPYSGIVWA